MYLRFTCLFSVLGTERLGSLVTPCALRGDALAGRRLSARQPVGAGHVHLGGCLRPPGLGLLFQAAGGSRPEGQRCHPAATRS